MRKSLTTKFVLAFTCFVMFVAGFITLGLNAKPQKVLASTECDHTTGWTVLTQEMLDYVITNASGTIPAGDYYLTENVSVSSGLEVASGTTVNVCLNGYDFSFIENCIMISGALNVCNCATTGAINGKVDINTGGSLTSNNVKIYLADFGEFVVNNKGTFTMNGGMIESGHSGNAGVSNYGTFVMEGGTFKNCRGFSNSVSNIFESATATINGGEFINCETGISSSINSIELNGEIVFSNNGCDIELNNNATYSPKIVLGSAFSVSTNVHVEINDTTILNYLAIEGVNDNNYDKFNLNSMKCELKRGTEENANKLILANHSHDFSVSEICRCGAHKHNGIAHDDTPVSMKYSSGTYLLGEGNYLLLNNGFSSVTAHTNGNVFIDLNGYEMKNTIVVDNGNLTITDCKGTGKFVGAVTVENGYSFTLNGGTIENCVTVNNGGIFTMNGGAIQNSTKGGLKIDNGANVILNGGVIANNTSEGNLANIINNASSSLTDFLGANCQFIDENGDNIDSGLEVATYLKISCLHSYDNDCDTTCNACSAIRTINHTYDNACDTTCNECNAVREITHSYDNDCDTHCNVCNLERSVEPHVYDNNCDTTCNECLAERSVDPHSYVWGEWSEGKKVGTCSCGKTVSITVNTSESGSSHASLQKESEGRGGELALKIEKDQTKINQTDKNKITENLGSQKALFIDISIIDLATSQGVANTDNVIEIAFKFDTANKTNIVVYRNHNGVVESFYKLDAKPTNFVDKTYYIDSANGTIYVYSNQFSTYGVAYDEVVENVAAIIDDTVDKEPTRNTLEWWAIVIIAIGCVIAFGSVGYGIYELYFNKNSKLK